MARVSPKSPIVAKRIYERSFGLETARATAAHADTDGAPYVQIPARRIKVRHIQSSYPEWKLTIFRRIAIYMSESDRVENMTSTYRIQGLALVNKMNNPEVKNTATTEPQS
jgi:hypothetical protein